MKTPYDAALRALDQEMDELKRVIRDAMERLTTIEAERKAIGKRIVEEQQLSTENHILFADAYLARARQQRASLDDAQRTAEQELSVLREKAAEQFASMRAIGNAADQYRQNVERERERAEQQLVDDVVAARFVRTMRHARDRKRQS
ncbi:hypothetical protein [Stakelama pacifica]|uniref:Flagellar FliJ protein n=1 Tax=Stakelama pacifica TaxID=517720 RepID=A0A4R6FKP5_9SPHN|nr:hypothetical protein [Stakelama pacifica]TDN81154.1 hypothetical protein EV664_10896 [Stakelama pacifica]GGO96912.1 hypothetical protein GCM10011329_24530 [Stakelama pacifica]